MAEALFVSSSHSAQYAKYRPSFPAAVCQRIIQFIEEKSDRPFSCAVDVGCGTGLFTELLADDFEQVTGTDISETQIAEAVSANTCKNIEYRVGSSYDIPVPDGSVDLVTAAQAAHWFDLEKFYSEVDRVLKPNGCIAVLGYESLAISHEDYRQEWSRMIREFKNTTRNSCAASHPLRLVDTKYGDIMFPYKDMVRDDSFEIKQEVIMSDYIAYIRTWSATQYYVTHHPEDKDIIKRLQQSFLEVLGVTADAENTRFEVSGKVFCILGRKPCH